LSEPDKPKRQTAPERIASLESRLDELSERTEELSKKIDALVGYQKQLYEYLLKMKR
jgi:predicted  nucleic acid-binding Zn-ribbon protein